MSTPSKQPRRPWTDAERDVLRERYATETAPALARRLNRSWRAIYQEAHAQGLQKSHRTPTGLAFRAEVRRLSAAGYTDTEIAGAMGCERHTVSSWRKRLGLPPQTYGARRRNRVRERTARQCAEAGVAALAGVRVLAFRKYAAESGWPADLRPRAVQILEALAANGPMTRPEIAAAVGMPWKGTRNSLVSNGPGGTYLAQLIARGLVVDLGRVVRAGGRGRNRHLYSLSLDAERTGTDGAS